MSDTAPAVSVMMTVYNAAPYVEKALTSILGQTIRDFEIIVIDDGSTDESAAIVQRIAERDERIRLVSRPNTGISKARNEALGLARGEFVAVQDADDESLPHRLDRQVRFLREKPDVVCVGSWFDAIDAAGRRLRSYQIPTDPAEIERTLLAGHAAICQPSSMLRRDAVQRVGGFDESLPSAEDLDLHLRLSEIGKLANLPEVLVRYRMHDASISSTGRERMLEAARQACERAWKRRGIRGNFEPVAPGRHDGTRTGRSEWTLECGWWAFNSGEKRTAAVYGLKTIAQAPWRSGGWRLLACSLLK
jgi:glycosyltransferase involved in cell wall biosynthesis